MPSFKTFDHDDPVVEIVDFPIETFEDRVRSLLDYKIVALDFNGKVTPWEETITHRKHLSGRYTFSTVYHEDFTVTPKKKDDLVPGFVPLTEDGKTASFAMTEEQLFLTWAEIMEIFHEFRRELIIHLA